MSFTAVGVSSIKPSLVGVPLAADIGFNRIGLLARRGELNSDHLQRDHCESAVLEAFNRILLGASGPSKDPISHKSESQHHSD